MGFYGRKGLKVWLLVSLLWMMGGMAMVTAQPLRVRVLEDALSRSTADTAQVRILAAIGFLYADVDLDSALAYGRRAETLASSTGDALSRAYAMTSLGRSFMHAGNYDLALKYLTQAMPILDSAKESRGLGLASVNTALVYAYLQNFPLSERYARYTYHIGLKTKDTTLQVWALLKHCDNHANSGKFDSLRTDAQRAFRLAGIIGDSGLLSRASAYLCLEYERRKIIDSCLAYRAISIGINQETSDNRGLAQDYFYLARFYLVRNEPDSAILYARRCRDLAAKFHFLYVERNALGALTEAYDGRNSDSALKYFKAFFQVNEELYGIRKNQQVNAVELNQQKLEQALEAERKQARGTLIVGVFGAMLAMALIAGFFLYRNIRSKHRINLELNRSLENLQSAQHQLVHAEKMASLGELTAGIAHEIQNPLNFVSNFAEVNTELIDDLQKAVDAGDMQEIRILTADIRANEEKIREHGKRADSIVKSMLQHSRSSTGQMEPTDVNALCEEYVRLAYHGMRAKEKNFNVDIRSYLSNGLPDVPMIRQDIGRVLLNIVNNAFHAVMERNSKAPAGYQPTVTIKTFIPADSRITAGKSVRMICMSIGDNGTGIPEALQKKIFQPFFTTKPTGQGTGLGLSLSYDIIRAHGGELTLESEPGRGTTFLIQLPIA